MNRTTAVAMAAFATLSLAPGSRADAAPDRAAGTSSQSCSPQHGTYVNSAFDGVWQRGSYWVAACWGTDYSKTTNHLRAWTRLVSNSSRTHLTADYLRLGTSAGVLRAATRTSPNGVLEFETDAVNCNAALTYISHLTYSIRWPDGFLQHGFDTGQLDIAGDAACDRTY